MELSQEKEQLTKDKLISNSLVEDIVCGHCGNIYPKVKYEVGGEDLKMIMECDEG